MANIMEIVVTAKDMASDVISKVGDQADETSSWISENWGKITAATAAAGVAAEGFARSQADTNAIIRRTAVVTGETEGEIRNMVNSMANGGFGADEITAGMEELIRRGITTTDQFENILPVMDSFSDATGIDVVNSIKIMDTMLGAMGLSLEDAGDHVDTFTFLSQKTSIPLEMFERQIGKVGPQLNKMGVNLEDSAAILAAMEGQGYSGRAALMEFALAADQAGGDTELFMEKLGLTQEQLAPYQQQVSDAAGITDTFGSINENTMTMTERLQQTVANLGVRFGGLAEAASIAAPALTAMGPILLGGEKLFNALKGSVDLAGKAMSFVAANPIVLIIAAIAALVAGLVWLYNNNETFRNFVLKVWEAIQNAIRWAWENVIQPVWNAIKAGIDFLIAAVKLYLSVWQAVFTAVGEAVKWVWNNVLKPTWDAIKGGIDTLRTGAETFARLWGNLWEGIKNAVRGPANGIIGFINAILGGVESLINSIGGGLNKLPKISIPDWVPGIGGKTFGLPHIGGISLPRIPMLASGGIIPATAGGMLAILGEGGRSESVVPHGPDGAVFHMDDKQFDRLIRALMERMTLSVDGRELASAMGPPLVDEIRQRTGM